MLVVSTGGFYQHKDASRVEGAACFSTPSRNQPLSFLRLFIVSETAESVKKVENNNSLFRSSVLDLDAAFIPLSGPVSM